MEDGFTKVGVISGQFCQVSQYNVLPFPQRLHQPEQYFACHRTFLAKMTSYLRHLLRHGMPKYSRLQKQ